MSKKYLIKPKISDNLVEQLLYNRGIKNREETDKFLNPDFEKHLYDPFLLDDMEKAVERILEAIRKNEKIGIWSDYDADGISGGVLLHDFFGLIGYRNFVNYIPDRHEEGYGLNDEGIERLKGQGIDMMITVDCGIRDYEKIEFLNGAGIDVVVTDHHEPGLDLPKSFAIINPKRKDSKYPEDILCGTGVVWKLVQAILSKKEKSGEIKIKKGQEKWLLDLVGLATLSDMVPLVGENRVLAFYGLTVLRKSRRPGFSKLFSNLGVSKNNLTEDDITFMVTPRINAASRMGCPMDAFNLLIAENEAEAESYVRHLDGINNERKGIVAAIVKEAKKKIKEKFETSGEKPVIVLGNPDWRPALLGLAANSIAEEFNKPVFLWGRSNGFIKGSCRSNGEVDVVDLMEKNKDHFIEYGGHKMSGGFSINLDKIHTLEDVLVESSTRVVTEDLEIFADAELVLKDVHEESISEILRLSPFGVGNEKPIFIFKDVVPERINRFGKSQDHLSVSFSHRGNVVRGISFFTSPDEFGDLLKEGIKTNLVANIEKSFWNGASEIRLRIIDFF